MSKNTNHPKDRSNRKEHFLYLGDNNVSGAAAYLAGVMTYCGFEYEHYSSDTVLDSEALEQNWVALVMSDYPARNISAAIMEVIVTKVNAGMGLLMIGGWESFQGLSGHYHATPLGRLLPVSISSDDDRVNCSGPCLISKVNSHSIIADLPFETDTPGIGGYNRFKAKKDATVILEARRYRASANLKAGHCLTALPDADPLLVTGLHGKGRVCAWASDVAPHWVGGLVDWGSKRVESRGKGNAEGIEVGDLYTRFFSNMLRWTAGLPG